MRQTSQDEEQSQLAENGFAERRSDAWSIDDLFQGIVPTEKLERESWIERGPLSRPRS